MAADLDLTPTTAAQGTRLPLYAEEHEALRASARAFVANELAPHVEAWEAAEDFPRDEVFRTVGAGGWLGLKFDERWGGSGPDYLAHAVWLEELVRTGSAGLNADLGAHADLALLYVDRNGDDQHKERYLRPGIAGETVGALGITEPGAGSDVAGITTRARRDGDDWVITGEKTFITNGAWCDWIVLAVKTDPEAADQHRAISLFVVDTDLPGVQQQRLKMLGWRLSHTGQLRFDDVRVPASAMLGAEGSGFLQIMQNFAWERVSMSIGASTAAQRTLEAAIAYAKERHAFGRPIASFQVWRHRFADLATRIATARALTYHALRLHVANETGHDVDPIALMRATAMAKLSTQRLAFEVADECVQEHGGYRYMMEYPAQRWWRDARLGPIGGGTDEIMKEILAKTYGL